MHPILRDRFQPSLRVNLRLLQTDLQRCVKDMWHLLRSGSELRRATKGRTGLLLHVGCGSLVLPGWTNVDADPKPRQAQGERALYWNMMNPLPLADGSVRRIHCEHFLEHLRFDYAEKFLAECRRVLEPGGSMRLIVPDAGRYMTAYAVNDMSFFGKLDGLGGASNLETKAAICSQMFHMWGDHLFGWDFETLERSCRKAGFTSIAPAAWNDRAGGYDVDGQDWWRPHESLYAEIS